jgi:histidinol phosphatase-like PHP family hydrolase
MAHFLLQVMAARVPVLTLSDMAPVTNDFHVHSSLSWCAGAEMTPAAIVATAGDRGVTVIGLADHLWLDPKRGSRPAVARLLEHRDTLACLGTPVRILLGAEADCAPGRGIAGGAELEKLDFAVAAYHFADVREGATPWPKTPADLAEILLAGFSSVVAAPGARIAGHPFFIPPSVYRRFPVSLQKSSSAAMEIVARRAGELFGRAAERGMAIELNVRALGPWYRRLLLPLFRTAAECGCGFVVSSDAHRLGELGRGGTLEDYLSGAGVTEELLERGGTAAGAGGRRNRPQS